MCVYIQSRTRDILDDKDSKNIKADEK